ncbi:MAG: hypothetical protein A2252_06560 [Elusimicrobia bacterium RIFOXYA2_FULL_39_19]|nr:MAG: hypothetical protein A2252_06560 [Elusimicrobia bacterium RIFOXYA2_FULL_39_19]
MDVKMFGMRKKLLLISVMLGLSPQILAADNIFWQTKASLSKGRTNIAAAVVNNKIYAIAGSSGSTYPTNVEEYNPESNSWTAKTAIPTGRTGPGIGVVNNKIYIIGGDPATNRKVEEFNPAMNSWVTKTNMPTARRTLACAVVNNKIYVVGGDGIGVTLSTVEEYDPDLDAWTSKTNMPTARYGLTAVAVNNKIYAIGGYNSSISSYLVTVEEYDPAFNTWSTKASMNTPRLFHSATVINSKIYIIGGCNSVAYLNSVEVYDPASNTWTPETSISTPRNGLSAVTLNNKIYAIGGYYSPPEVYHTKVEEGTIFTYAISGYVKDASNTAISGVTVSLTGSSTTATTTNSNGLYQFMDLQNGSYTTSPTKTNYTFSPTNLTYSNLTSTQTNQNFTGTYIPPTYSISGYVKNASSTAISAVTITLTGSASATATTGADGSYSFSNLVNGNYTITPTKTNYTFNPTNLTYSNLTNTQTNQNFTGTYNPSNNLMFYWNMDNGINSPQSPQIGLGNIILNNPNGAITSTSGYVNNGVFFPNHWATAGHYAKIDSSNINTNKGIIDVWSKSSGNSLFSSSGTTSDRAFYTRINSNPPYQLEFYVDGINYVNVQTDGKANWYIDGSWNHYRFCWDKYSGIAEIWINDVKRSGSIQNVENWTHYGIDYLAIGGTPGRAYNGTDGIIDEFYIYDNDNKIISGFTKDGNNNTISNVTMTLTGSDNYTTTTDSDGSFSFSVSTGGTYTITPSKTGYTFSPVNKEYSSLNENKTSQNFTGTENSQNPTTYSISGYIKDASSTAISAVTVSLTGTASATATTGADGSYSFANLASGTHTITPSKTGYTFSPANKEYSSLNENKINQDFTATLIPVPDNPPTITLTSPGNRATVNGNYNIKAETTDDNGISKIDLYIDNVLLRNTKTVAIDHWLWDTTLETEGEHTIKAIAYDTANQTAAAEVTVSIHQQPANKNVVADMKPEQPIVEPGSGKKAKIKFSIDLPADKKAQEGEAAKIHVRITIHSVRGELVKTLVDEDMALGQYQQEWDGKSFENEVTGSGVYIVKIQAGDYRATQKIVVIR